MTVRCRFLLLITAVLLNGCVINVINGRDPQRLVSQPIVNLATPSAKPGLPGYYPLGLVQPRFDYYASYYPAVSEAPAYYPDYGSGYVVAPASSGAYPCPAGFTAFPYYPRGYWCKPRPTAYYPAYYPYHPYYPYYPGRF